MLTAQQHMNAHYIMMLTVEIAGLFKTNIKFNWGKKSIEHQLSRRLQIADYDKKPQSYHVLIRILPFKSRDTYMEKLNLEVYTYKQYTSAQMGR